MIRLIGRKESRNIQFRILVTSFTSTAIDTFSEKFNALLKIGREKGLFGEWASDEKVMMILKFFFPFMLKKLLS